ncbi:MAG: hypothetical protein GWN99_18130 [Gemmatimonadetes bacterium]|uniref:Uncharacterized protein n=1 Tax=Candidatus Kutchimonas denitrificans TaxID=3056748 RepID=A0AAE5CB22_9BACT|nr:hypothetical protein [Gemmatimonadota bacterium]NIR73965.1 hypothetical protein [Candidatus Kutchimonas denitrificans]NIS02954.1 hypothetical protein [Gemmatimonadota bacterium]NIT68671.1 hypothetical protein [Gemmatimonadota bacterium]NIU53252.1 hypothetical protein [Gemmatimonadota bacterium]
MDTGYWISDGKIYSPDGFTGYVINQDRRIVGARGYTRHWLFQGQIYSQKNGNTGFRVYDTRIHGPSGKPPWERPFN